MNNQAKSGGGAKAPGWVVFGLGFGVVVLLTGAEAFWTGLLETVLGLFLLLNWRILIMPHAYFQHFIKYNDMFRFLAVSALLAAVFLAGLPAPFLFFGMLFYVSYILKVEPWTKEMKDLSSTRWSMMMFVIALALAAVTGVLQMKLSAMNTDGVSSSTFSTLQMVLKYWLMLTVIAWLGLMSFKVLLMAKQINLGLDDTARNFLVASGIPQNEKNVADFLKNDIRTQENAKALCEKNNIHPTMLRFAGKSPKAYEALMNIPALLALPLVLSFFPCALMFVPSMLNCSRFQASPPSESKVLRGFGLRRLDGTLE